MIKNRTFMYLYSFIFGVGFLLRLSLITFNREANDSHEAVAKIIIQTGRLPQKDECWECFQPKLYHSIFALALKALGLSNNPAYQQNVVGQFINFIAGILTLTITFIFIKGLGKFEEKIKLIAFALIALNPNLIGINSQATNDSLVILFSTAAIYCAYRFMNEQQLKFMVSCILFSILGVSTKTNAWVTVIAITLSFIIWGLVEKQRKERVFIFVYFLASVAILSVLNPFNQYIPNYKRFGSPILMNLIKDPFPHFSGEYTPEASGIWYIGDGFFTFKFIDLIKHPRLDPATDVYLPHQTSFWTVLYGRAHSIHFDNAPPAWSTSGDHIFHLERIVYSLALVPTGFMLFGVVEGTVRLIKSFVKKDYHTIKVVYYGLFVLVFTGYISFQILYSFQYRSVTVIKAIFIFPALLSFAVFFMETGKSFYTFFSKGKRWITVIFESIIVLLLFFYVVDVLILIIDLARIYFQKHFL
jgi:hypothetical protein